MCSQLREVLRHTTWDLVQACHLSYWCRFTLYSVVSVIRPRSLPEAFAFLDFSGCWVGLLSLGWLVWCFLMMYLPQTTVYVLASVPTVILVKMVMWEDAGLFSRPLKRSDSCFTISGLFCRGDLWILDLHLSSPSSDCHHWVSSLISCFLFPSWHSAGIALSSPCKHMCLLIHGWNSDV